MYPTDAAKDINGDGSSELILDKTNSYVFCGACGVIFPELEVYRWTGSVFEPIPLALLNVKHPPDIREPNNRAVRLAQGGLWHEAQTLINQADDLNAANDLVTLNAALINLLAEAKANA